MTAERPIAPDDSFAEVLVQQSPDALVALAPDGAVLFWNQGAQSLFGFSEREAIGRVVDDLLCTPEDRPEAAEMRQIVLREGSAMFEGVLRRKDGTPIDVRVTLQLVRGRDGAVRFIAANHKDVSQLKNLLHERASDAKFRGLLEAAPDAMVIFGSDGLIALVNGQTEKMFGYPREDLLGESVDRLLPERFRSHQAGRPSASFDPVIPVGEPALDLYGRRRDGSEFPIDITLSPMQTRSGKLITAAVRDITERKHLEERMQHANRLKSEFLANMSHELRTPLNAIIGFAEVMYDGEVEPGSPQCQEFLSHILTSSHHLLQLVNDILDLSKIEAGKMEFHPEPVEISQVVEEVVSMLGAIAAAKRISVETAIDVAVTSIVLDPARLKQVLYNYLSNALKFTPPGGRVTISAVLEDADRFRLEVEDTGSGIQPEDLDRLFVEFQQLDEQLTKKHSGTGLGLALTKRIVTAQGGSVGVRSVPGQGSVFHAVLPRSTQVAPPTPTGPKRPTGEPAIVVIDHHGGRDSEHLHLLTAILSGAGYQVTTAKALDAASPRDAGGGPAKGAVIHVR